MGLHAVSTSELLNAYALIRDEKAANTAGGTFTAGAWRTRDLNTEAFDPDGIVSLAANQFTLQAGTYFIEASAQAYNVGSHKLKIANITDTTDTLIGQSAYQPTNGSFTVVSGRFTIAAQKTFELQHRCSVTAATEGFGVASNFGVVEVYTEVQIWRETA